MPRPHHAKVSSCQGLIMPRPHHAKVSSCQGLIMPRPHHAKASSCQGLIMPRPHHAEVSSCQGLIMPRPHHAKACLSLIMPSTGVLCGHGAAHSYTRAAHAHACHVRPRPSAEAHVARVPAFIHPLRTCACVNMHPACTQAHTYAYSHAHTHTHTRARAWPQVASPRHARQQLPRRRPRPTGQRQLPRQRQPAQLARQRLLPRHGSAHDRSGLGRGQRVPTPPGLNVDWAAGKGASCVCECVGVGAWVRVRGWGLGGSVAMLRIPAWAGPW